MYSPKPFTDIRYCAGDIFQYILLKENARISIKIS